ncbi:MAG: UBP-type zinc finger domain-containing protein, partial [archaeon]|nr:UBP-type zinc finger domain-containing protein [archaeon]
MENKESDLIKKESIENLNENKGKNCPYIGTIKRHMLDFDFEKVCSITLSTQNVYACLICGKYFQGCGISTCAYNHSLEESHHLFINLSTEAIICLPDNYEVFDPSLNNIKSNLKPKFTKEEIKNLDLQTEFSYSLEGKEFLPGCIGLNNTKCNDYVNVIIQSLVRLEKFRNFFLSFDDKNTISKKSEGFKIFSNLIKSISDICKKIWNKENFKGHISPHELLQAISLASQKKFVGNKQSDAILFLSWLLSTLDTYFSKKKGTNIITDNFVGYLQLETFTLIKDEKEYIEKSTSKGKNKNKIIKLEGLDYLYEIKKVPFYYLSLELPHTPLFKDSNETINIPQVSIYELFKKFNGQNFVDDPIKGIKKRYKVLEYPNYLILVFHRFENNMFFTEKNPTIVNFPIESLEIEGKYYDLCSNVIHDGKPNEGRFRVQVKHKGRNEWYEIQDLNVDKIMPESVTVSESYIHFYEINKNKEKK